MKSLVVRVGTLVVALSALTFVVINAGLSGSCARGNVVGAPRAAQGNAGSTSPRFLPSTKAAILLQPPNAPKPSPFALPDPRFFPATKAAPVFLPPPAQTPPAEQPMDVQRPVNQERAP